MQLVERAAQPSFSSLLQWMFTTLAAAGETTSTESIRTSVMSVASRRMFAPSRIGPTVPDPRLIGLSGQHLKQTEPRAHPESGRMGFPEEPGPSATSASRDPASGAAHGREIASDGGSTDTQGIGEVDHAW